MSEDPSPVLDLGAVRDARAAEAKRREAMRPFLVHVMLTSIALLPPGADQDMTPESVVLDAADLFDDPGRLGEIARALVARAGAGRPRAEG